jgi:DNA adenine methylase
MTSDAPKVPIPYFGSKRRVATIVWTAFGTVSNYVEPFCGSLAILLAAPTIAKIETVNDISHHLINWWRAVSNDPIAVAQYADVPVSEVELHARHHYLIDNATEEFRTKMETDPDYYDAKMAGYFVYGQSISIGSNWLQPKGLKAMPLLSSAGSGIFGLTYGIQEQFSKLQQRLRRVRVCCGDWKRIMTPSVLDKNKGLSPKDITAIFLDSPYSLDNRDKVYAHDQDVYREVAQWALDNGDNPRLRIAMCGYQGDAQFPAWQEYQWTGSGMGNMSDKRGKNNQSRECIWFSPHCLEINSNANHQ